jgi:hypothetical protein
MADQRRTALGKVVDMSVIATRHEKTRAVGNMGVNARGDIINSNNQIIRDRTSRIENQNNKKVSSAFTEPVFEETVPLPVEELSKDELEFEQEDSVLEKEIVKIKNTKSNKV